MRIPFAALVSVLLLSACGARSADPVANTRASDGKDGARAGLDTMVVPQRPSVGGRAACA